MDLCPSDTLYRGAFSQYIAVAPIILLQLLLFCQTIYQEYTKRNTKAFRHILMYIALQICGLVWSINDLLKFVIAPYLPYTPSIQCTITTSIPRIDAVFYYFFYVYIILSRLYYIFKDSPFQINRNTFFCLKVTAVTTYMTAMIVYLATNIDHIHICLREWIPVDTGKYLLYCSVPDSNDIASGLFLVGATFIFNIILTVMFTVKLNKLLSHNDDNEEIRFEFKTLIVKICILSMAGAISTISCWVLWMMMPAEVTHIDDIFLYLDLLVNATVIGLMFKYNDKYYRTMCRSCILLCFLGCGRSTNTAQNDKLHRELETYFEHQSAVADKPRLTLVQTNTATNTNNVNSNRPATAIIVFDDHISEVIV
mmetsp:Transcript_58133/g.92349  ORF Transcript_58133/g.92349 Transcript_58133/m.92349 type:complete len:367 (+) Transcript_58133:37-1137(+)